MNPVERAEWERVSRDAAYEAMVEAGMPPEIARTSADMGAHAAAQAVETLLRITKPLDGPAWLNAVTSACGIAIMALNQLADDLAEKASEAGLIAKQLHVAMDRGEAS